MGTDVFLFFQFAFLFLVLLVLHDIELFHELGVEGSFQIDGYSLFLIRNFIHSSIL